MRKLAATAASRLGRKTGASRLSGTKPRPLVGRAIRTTNWHDESCVFQNYAPRHTYMGGTERGYSECRIVPKQPPANLS